MKRILIAFSVLFMAMACNQKTANQNAGTPADGKPADPTVINNPSTPAEPDAVTDPNNAPNITFENEHVTIKNPITEGETIEVVFSFTNTGNAPLVLKGVQPACGCTVTDDWPKDPIPAGGKGKIKAKFDSSHKPGENTKAITITTNAPRPKDMFDIKFTVKVNPKEENKQ